MTANEWLETGSQSISSGAKTATDHLWSTQLEMLSGMVEETRRKLLVKLFLNYNATKSVLHRIPIFKQRVRQDSQAFAPRLVSTAAAASDEENLKGSLRRLNGLGVSGKVLCYVKVVLKVDLDIDFVGETYAMKIPKQGHYKDLLERQIKALAGASQSIDWEISPSEFDLNDSVIGSSGEIRRAIWGGPPIEVRTI
ncbi:unnamed protein product [Sphagnum tenellum]